jgi:hypothetical protein
MPARQKRVRETFIAHNTSVQLAIFPRAGPPAELCRLAWLGRPFVLPLESIANTPIAAHAVLKAFERHWPAIAAKPELRTEAEGRVIDIVHAACGNGTKTEEINHWLIAALVRFRELLQSSVQHCWTPEQRRTL